jgi:hypothetical protein
VYMVFFSGVADRSIEVRRNCSMRTVKNWLHPRSNIDRIRKR